MIKLIQEVCIYKGKAVDVINNPSTLFDDPVDLCRLIGDFGVDALYMKEFSSTPEEKKANLELIADIYNKTQVPFIMRGEIETMDDVEDYVSTGADKVVLDLKKQSNRDLLKPAIKMFGSNMIAIKPQSILTEDLVATYKKAGVSLIIKSNPRAIDKNLSIPIIYNGNDGEGKYALSTIKETYNDNIQGYIFNFQTDFVLNYMNLKTECRNAGFPVKIYEPAFKFSDLKLNSDGMIPVIVQDVENDQVLMMAYMNEQAYYHTIQTGRMTYYSRSRNELWEKGLTSGHFQYFKELYLDCDKDTILAKVHQIGAACHTGSRSCFFNEVVKKEF